MGIEPFETPVVSLGESMRDTLCSQKNLGSRIWSMVPLYPVRPRFYSWITDSSPVIRVAKNDCSAAENDRPLHRVVDLTQSPTTESAGENLCGTTFQC
jgi:hypothetical protein